ncbi:hypothetical protein [Streptomyces fagopyri]|uniref:hypothetical protein n=1 Tax=Streptomyces fagopyri TaxID=2662397 RepID=UPI0037FA4809
MAEFSIRVYRYDADTKEMHEVSTLERSVDTMPNLPLIDTRWPLCECYSCQGNGTLNGR